MSQSFFNRLPSVQELLDQVPLKALVNQMTAAPVVQQVQAALTDFRDELQSAATEKRFPNLTELAERIAQRIRATAPPTSGPLLNATGVVLHPRFGLPWLAEDAWKTVRAAGAEFHPADTTHAGTMTSLLTELTGAEAAWVTASFPAAIWLTLKSIAGGGQALFAQGEWGALASGERLAQLCAAAAVEPRCLGVVGSLLPAELHTALQAGPRAAVRFRSSQVELLGNANTVSGTEWLRLAHEQSVPVIEIHELATQVDLADAGLAAVPTLRSRLEAGVDLLIVTGDKLLGGPPVGLILGREKWLSRIRSQFLAQTMQADPLALAALQGTWQLYRTPDRATSEIPALQLLTTSAANLQNRAERLAPQMAVAPAIATAVPVATTTTLASWNLAGQTLPSWAIELTPKTGPAEALASALLNSPLPVVTTLHGNHVRLDLRSVFARQDQSLVAAVLQVPATVATSN